MLRSLAEWLFSPPDLTPHGFCLLWEPWLIWSQAIGNCAIGLAYIAIPLALTRFASLRRDLAFKPVFWLFASFILLCGATHWADLVTLWVPAYRVSAILMVATAIVSVATAITVWHMLPLALTIPAPAQLRAADRALRQSEDMLRMSADIARIGGYRLDIVEGRMHCPPEVHLMHGYASNGEPVTDAAWLAMLLPEDRQRVGEELAAAYAARQQVTDICYRIEHPTDGMRHFERRCHIEYDSAGRPVHAICVVVDTTERRRSEARLAHLAHHDPLTGLANRNLLGIRLGEAMTRAAAGEAFAILCIDLDRFKDVNDMFGHAVGDALLIAVAARMAAALRPTDTVARLGGDEFAVIQTQIDEPANASVLAARLIAVLGEPFDIAGNHIVISVSIGIAIAGEKTPDSERLLRNADIAMYAAKTTGARRYRIFATEMDEKIQARCRLETELRQAFDNNEFELFYQPLVNVDTHLPCAFEALLRWRHPREGLVMPSRFIQVAETTGLIVPIGAWILQTACTEAARWPNDLRVSVNLSAVQFSDGDLLQAIKVALCKSGLNPRRLELEITESVMLRDTMATLEALHEMKTLGVSVAMDDFGTGYSSLSYLQRFPFDRLKIDRSFVASLGTTQESRAIVEAVVCLCSGLGIGTIAEGVETKTQLAVLTEIGCTEAQGYLFSPPCSTKQISSVIGHLENSTRAAAPSEIASAVALGDALLSAAG